MKLDIVFLVVSLHCSGDLGASVAKWEQWKVEKREGMECSRMIGLSQKG